MDWLTRETVYFILGGELVKIGKSRDPERRMKDLQMMCPVPLTLARTIKSWGGFERALHKHLDEYRKHGEWFDLAAWQYIEPLTDGQVMMLCTDVRVDLTGTRLSASYAHGYAALSSARLTRSAP